jgi:hypothetical protein
MHRAANIAANNVFARVSGRTDRRYIVGKARSGELQCTVDDTYNRIKSQTTQLTQEAIWDWAGEACNKVILLCHKSEGLSMPRHGDGTANLARLAEQVGAPDTFCRTQVEDSADLACQPGMPKGKIYSLILTF